MKTICIGTAGWAISKKSAPFFPTEGTHLERYSKILNAVEINSSFYRHHQEKTYRRWNDSVPADFRFSVKLSREITHNARLHVEKETLREILSPLSAMDKARVLLVQLPPSLQFSRRTSERFFEDLRFFYPGPVAVEPRHPSWTGSADVFKAYGLAKVKADPEPVPDEEGKFDRSNPIQYFRLHGSPEIYQSDYSDSFLQRLRRQFDSRETWVIFDNTMDGHALKNALSLSGYFSEVM